MLKVDIRRGGEDGGGKGDEGEERGGEVKEEEQEENEKEEEAEAEEQGRIHGIRCVSHLLREGVPRSGRTKPHKDGRTHLKRRLRFFSFP